MIPILLAGVVLSGIAGGIAGRLWGGGAGIAAASFGGVATMIQLVAMALMRPVRVGGNVLVSRFMARWGAGMGLRLLGVVVLALVVALDRTHFPPLPVALGFLGVLLPLLELEVILVR